MCMSNPAVWTAQGFAMGLAKPYLLLERHSEVRTIEQNERAYWTKEVAERLGVGHSTLRKWCMSLEEHDYQFTKGQRGVRAFLERDIEVLTRMRDVLNETGTTLEEAVSVALEERENGRTQVVPSPEQSSVEQENDGMQVAMSPQLLLESFKADLLGDVRREVLEALAEQERRTIEREQERDQRTAEREEKRDQALLAVIREVQETKKLIAAAEEKQSWFRRFVESIRGKVKG